MTTGRHTLAASTNESQLSLKIGAEHSENDGLCGCLDMKQLRL